MIHVIRLLVGIMTLAVVIFICAVVYNLFMKFGILFIAAVALLLFAYWIGYELFDI